MVEESTYVNGLSVYGTEEYKENVLFLISGASSPVTPKLPSPNVKNVHSKIGSMDNARHTPGGGNVRTIHSNRYDSYPDKYLIFLHKT